MALSFLHTARMALPRGFDGGEYVGGFGHASDAFDAAGEPAGLRSDDFEFHRSQHFDVALDGGMGPHLLFMAGAIRTGLFQQAHRVVLRRSSQIPQAALAMILAVAGATTIISAASRG